MTEELVQQYIEGYQWLDKRIREVACIVAKIRKTLYKHTPEECYESNFEINGLVVTAHFSESTCSCCSSEDYYISFPTSYLWITNVEAVETKDWADFQAEEKRKADAKAKADEEARQKLKAKQDRELYDRLKMQFEK